MGKLESLLLMLKVEEQEEEEEDGVNHYCHNYSSSS